MSIRVLTVTMSDTRTPENDESGRALAEALRAAGFEHVRHLIFADEPDILQELCRTTAGENHADAIVITGGTGIGPRDNTPDALEAIFDKELRGFGEAFRRLSFEQIGAHAILSRATAGVVGCCVVYALPGSVRAAKLGVEALVVPTLRHAVELAQGRTAHATAKP
jgi:molybdenum cofactor biosynthesis protein B